MAQKKLGIYIHIPFCKSKCPYCDFCSFPHPSAEMISSYTEELCNRIAKAAPALSAYTIDTIYFGGGTPTLLSARDAHRIMHTLHHHYDILPDAEVTLECNPATADALLLGAWKALGANRLSMGAQSAHANELKALGRLHTWEDVCHTVETARSVGIDNINVDFMMGIPLQTQESLADTLHKAISLAPEHLSSYCLSLEEGTPYHRKGATALGLPDDDTVAEMYLLSAELLKDAGYEHYEISNFCRDGAYSRHNLHTWQAHAYMGFGVGAHSYLDGKRFGNNRDIHRFLAGEDISDYATALPMTPMEAATEAVILGLRLSRGVYLSQIATRFGVQFPTDIAERLSLYQSQGLLTVSDGGDHLTLTEAGWLVSNQILADIWDILEENPN